MSNPYDSTCKRCGKGRLEHHDVQAMDGYTMLSICPSALFEYQAGEPMSPAVPRGEQFCAGCHHGKAWHKGGCSFGGHCACEAFRGQ